ncbi:hypothetical protein D3C80_1043860 [compost metagenome]
MVVLGQGGAHADANALFAAQAHGLQRTGEAAFELAKGIVGGLKAIDADADVVEAGRANLGDVALIDQRAVARQGDEHALVAGMGTEQEQVAAQQRLAAGENQHLDPGIGQVIDHLQGRFGIQLVTKHAVGRGGVAVLAGQVATPEQVPDHHRRARAARWAGARGRAVAGQGAQVLADSQHATLLAQWLVGRRKPVFFRMRLLTSMSSARQASPSR